MSLLDVSRAKRCGSSTTPTNKRERGLLDPETRIPLAELGECMPCGAVAFPASRYIQGAGVLQAGNQGHRTACLLVLANGASISLGGHIQR